MQSTCVDAGASPEAIQHHYDVGNDFYQLWLDPTLTYSCALWDEGDDDSMLAVAQQRKIRHHACCARVSAGSRILDIGCGWGAGLKYAIEEARAAQAVGLTLSKQQADWIAGFNLPGIEVRLENWMDHAAAEPYDAIISVGAFEHFARPDWEEEAKVAAYRAFFKRCHGWLKPGRWMSLQTIAYGNVDRRAERNSATRSFLTQDIFPESEIPALEEICQASAGLFELVQLKNDRADYARTCRVWGNRLRTQRLQAEALAGTAVVSRYMRYLKLSEVLFYYGQIGLLRIAFRRLDQPHM